MPDIEHNLWSLEVKASSSKNLLSSTIRKGMSQAIAAAIGTDKTPIVCVTQRGEPDGSTGRPLAEHYVIMRRADFVEWHGP